MKKIFKRFIITVLCITSIISSIISVIPIAKADSFSILGTQSALGSPILNNNFTLDDWNKWEIVCWGVFLSNFCQPLIDSYESAFKTTGSGSNGSGYQALCFGSGSDQENNKTIESFCDYAITQQKATKKKLYVGHSLLDASGKLTKNDPNDGGTVRDAKFTDMFLTRVDNVDDLDPDKSNYFTSSGLNTDVFLISNYKNVKYMTVYLPTFYMKNGSKYIPILDFTSSWDIQAASAIVNAVRTKSEYAKEFIDNYTKYTEEDTTIYLDPFANIMVDNKMLFPAAANPNLTKEKKINLLNSWIMNGYSSTYSNEKIVLGLRQNLGTGWFPWWRDSKFWRVGGMPAYGESSIGNVALLYYDLDSIMVKKFLSSGSQSINYGEAVENLFSQDITKHNTSKYPLKFEIAGNGFMAKELIKSGGDFPGLSGLTLAASMIPNYLDEDKQPELISEIVKMDGSKQSIFSNTPVVVAPQLLALNPKEMSSDDATNEGAIREFYNFLYEGYSGQIKDTTSGKFDSSTVSTMLKNSATISDLRTNAEKHWQVFQNVKTKYSKTKFPSSFWDYGKNESISQDSSRLTLAYPASEVIKGVSSVLCVEDGTEFSLYSTMLYMTYLDWYGVSNKTTLATGTEKTSSFSEEIYSDADDLMNLDPSSLTDIKSEDELESEVLQMSYLMLHPEEGRSYRKELIFNGLSDFLYEQYNRTVFGGKSDTYSGSASKSNSGFLAIETYAENWLTSWFLDNYTDIAVWIIAVCCIAIIIIGLFKSRKLSWYVFSMFVVVNVVLLVPSSGDIVPYVTSGFVQSMFTNNMTYWSISEGIANADIEADSLSATGDFDNMSEEDAKSMISLIKQLNTVYLDRSLMLKQDISQKLTQKLGGIYSELQSLPSARWILPMVMQQFSADAGSTEYLYVKLGNVWDDATNLYWYYKPTDALSASKQTLTSEQFVSESANKADSFEKYSNGALINYFQDYTLVSKWEDDTTTNINYANYSYTVNNNEDDIVHLYAYLIPDGMRQVTSRKAYYEGSSDASKTSSMNWDNYITGTKTKPISNWETSKVGSTGILNAQTAASGFEVVADTYDRTDAETLKPGYGFYKHTESPYYYFFNVVKDSFDSTKTVGNVIGNLQGQIEEDDDGNEVRSNFMYATKTTNKETLGTSVDGYTGYVRDCLDLQNFFTNTVPYLYQMTLMTGGYDGKSGILGDSVISEESDMYAGTLQSWAYRCNWAVKLMENKQLRTNTACKVKDASGKSYTVSDPMLADSYPASRPMIFSEAQMHAYGLEEDDLNLIELKCLKVNADVVKKWTLLINYAGTDGLTKEVLFRQMAIDALQIFNTEFSSGGLLNNKYSLYPKSIDLRYLSFDSIMKMLMLNVSKDTSYVYGDTMSKLLNDTDILTAVFLMLAAWLCAFIIPLARVVLLALIFYLGFGSIIRSLFSSPKQKARIACGQLISNLVFMLYTLIYYACFSGLMAISSSDEVLSISRIESNAGNPVWVILAVILASCLYIFAMAYQIRFCLMNFKDMGIESYSMIAGAMVGKLQDSISKVGSGISNFFGGNDTVNNSSSTSSINGTGIKNDKTQNVNVTSASGDTITVTKSDSDIDNDLQDDLYEDYYSSGDDNRYAEVTSSDDINAEIEAGSKM